MGKIQSFITCLIVLFVISCCGNGCDQPGTKIYCGKCKKSFYKYIGEVPSNFTYKDLVNVAPKVEYPESWVCPKDNAPLNGWKYWFWERKRHEPVMVYPAVTVLIKRDGKFIWVPDDIKKIDVGK